MKNNIITIDWTDEVLAKTCLTHAGTLHYEAPKPDQPVGSDKTTPPAKSAKPAARAA
jgi:NAD(P) transhydrogenase subunit alpha